TAHAGRRNAGGTFAPLTNRAVAGILDHHVLRIGDFTIVLEEVSAAGAGDGGCAFDAGDPVHDVERVLPQVGHLAAGVIPEPAEVVNGAVRVVGPLRRRTKPEIIIKVRGRRLVGWLAETRRDVAKVIDLDRDEFADPSGADQLARPLIVRAGPLLRADLHHAFVAPRDLDHPTTFAHEQRQRLLHIYVLTRGAGHHRHQRMPVIRRGDNDGIDIFVFKQFPGITILWVGTAYEL